MEKLIEKMGLGLALVLLGVVPSWGHSFLPDI